MVFKVQQLLVAYKCYHCRSPALCIESATVWLLRCELLSTAVVPLLSIIAEQYYTLSIMALAEQLLSTWSLPPCKV